MLRRWVPLWSKGSARHFVFLKATLKTEIPHGGKAAVCQREVLCFGQAGSTARGQAIWPLLGLELYSS